MSSSGGAIRAGRAFIEIFADGSKLESGLKQFGAKFKAFGSAIGDVGKKLTLIGGAALAPLLAAAKMFGSAGAEMSEMSARTGIAVEQLSELKFAASQTGVDMETLEGAIRKMQKTLVSAAQGGGSKGMEALGLSIRDLAALNPAEQFRLIGERLSQIADPTVRAGVAMEIFGKTGTSVLPMLASGAEGLDRYAEQARKLGLVMSTQSAEAGERFHHTLKNLQAVLESGFRSIGEALVPTLQAAANWLGRAAIAARTWIAAHGDMIVRAFQIAAAILAVGVSLVALGKVIALVGAGISGILTIVHGVGAGISTLGTLLTGILSPFGLVLAAAAALGGYLVASSGVGGKAIEWLGEKFTTLKDEAMAAFQGIGDALAAGDIALAAKVLWTTLKMWWTKGVSWISGIWQDCLQWIKVKFAEAWGGVRMIFNDIGHGLIVAWIETTAFLSKTWTEFCGFVQKAWAWAALQLTKLWNSVKAIFSDFDAEAANKTAETAYEAKKKEIEDEKAAKLKAREEERQAERAKETKDYNAYNQSIIDETEAKKKALQEEHDLKVKQAEEDERKAREEWKETLRQAKQARQEKEAGEGLPTVAPQEDLLGKAKLAMGAGLADLATAHTTTAGTFSAEGAFGFGGAGSSLQAIRDNTKRGADAEEKIAEYTRLMSQKTTGPEFSP